MPTPHTLIELSHSIEDGMITYKGLPAPIICDYLSRKESQKFYSEGVEFQIGKIEMVGNTGTYLDSPFHRYSGGKDLAALELEKLANLEGIVVRSTEQAIGPELFQSLQLAGKAVLVHTGWDKHWRTDHYFEGNPYLTKESTLYLRDSGAALVGIDSLNIDDIQDKSRPAHTILLAAGIPIVEHLCHLEKLPDQAFRFYAVPPKVEGMGTFPVRAFGVIE